MGPHRAVPASRRLDGPGARPRDQPRAPAGAHEQGQLRRGCPRFADVARILRSCSTGRSSTSSRERKASTSSSTDRWRRSRRSSACRPRQAHQRDRGRACGRRCGPTGDPARLRPVRTGRGARTPSRSCSEAGGATRSSGPGARSSRPRSRDCPSIPTSGARTCGGRVAGGSRRLVFEVRRSANVSRRQRCGCCVGQSTTGRGGSRHGAGRWGWSILDGARCAGGDRQPASTGRGVGVRERRRDDRRAPMPRDRGRRLPLPGRRRRSQTTAWSRSDQLIGRVTEVGPGEPAWRWGPTAGAAQRVPWWRWRRRSGRAGELRPR